MTEKKEFFSTPAVSPDPSPLRNPKVKHFVIVKEYSKRVSSKEKNYLQKTILKEQLQTKDIKSERNSLENLLELTMNQEAKECKTFLIATTTPNASPKVTPNASPCVSPIKKCVVNLQGDASHTETIQNGQVNSKADVKKWWDLRRIALVGALVVGGSIGVYHISSSSNHTK